MYLLLDENRIVRCMASEECNLHKDKIEAGMVKVEADPVGIVGDKYDPSTEEWEAHPENYPQPTEDQKNEAVVREEIIRADREKAIKKLINEGKLPPDYEVMGMKHE